MRFPDAAHPLPPASRRGALALVALLFTTACGACGSGSTGDAGSTAGTGGAGTATGTGGATGDAGTGDAATGDAAAVDGGIDRGPTAIALDADANGLWWDEATDTLYLADDENNRVLAWTDSGGSRLVANLPAQTQSDPGLGQVIKTADGKLVVTRFGYGTTGDVAFINADLSTGTVPNLDPTRRRIGLTVASDGTLYDTYFVKTTTAQIGAVARLDLTQGAEVDVVTSLTKPVGVLASGTNLLISDQATNAVLQAPIAMPSMVTSLVPMITGPDLLCNGPGGTYFTGGSNGAIRQITLAGQYSTFAGGFLTIRGVAYDAKNKRLFAAEHDPAGLKNALRILPVN